VLVPGSMLAHTVYDVISRNKGHFITSYDPAIT
jgi:hypothetical protein